MFKRRWFYCSPISTQSPLCHVWLEHTMKYHLLQSYIYCCLPPFSIFFIRSAQSRVILQPHGFGLQAGCRMPCKTPQLLMAGAGLMKLHPCSSVSPNKGISRLCQRGLMTQAEILHVWAHLKASWGVSLLLAQPGIQSLNIGHWFWNSMEVRHLCPWCAGRCVICLPTGALAGKMLDAEERADKKQKQTNRKMHTDCWSPYRRTAILGG